MTVKSKAITVEVNGRTDLKANHKVTIERARVQSPTKGISIPVTLESLQLCLNNAERLFEDSQNVSVPSAFALLEISMEETSKALGLLMAFEMKQFKENPNSLQKYMELSGIAQKEYNEVVQKISKDTKDFFEKNGENFFLMPFDEKTWKDHKSKVDYISEFIVYMKKVTFPILRGSQNRLVLIESLYGKHFPKLAPESVTEIDKKIYEILSINEQHLEEIINMKNQSLYVELTGNSLVDPSSRNYVLEVLESLTWLLITVIKNEIGILSKAIA